MSATGIRFYVEGASTGAKSNAGKSDARKAFHIFLTEIRHVAVNQNLEWHSIKLCGSRQSTYENFCSSLANETEIFHVLLVDAEENAEGNSYESGKIWDYLSKHSGDGWIKPAKAEEHHVYLMVRTMETWIVADRENLKKFYGRDFHENAIPKNSHLENVMKNQLEESLDRATVKTSKGKYSKNKSRDSFFILMTTDPEIVKEACLSCRRLFTELLKVLQTS